MFLKRDAFALVCYVILHFTSMKADTPNGKSNENFDEDDDDMRNDHPFVALIDIVFTDGSKRTCTGSIIHENVVITAAHCFCHQYTENIKPELTASFVVIGTKKMFDTGYEQYLPIERILTHPQFRGWTADLSLIYTFAAMTSDKPGRIIPLAGEKMSNPVDSNVTVFSWGHCKDEAAIQSWHISMTKEPCSEESSEDFKNQDNIRVTAGINSKRSRGQEKSQEPQNQAEQLRQHLRPQSRFQKESRIQTDLLHRYPILQQKIWDKQTEERPVEDNKESTSKRLSRYLTSNEDNVEIDRDYRQEPKNLTFMPHPTIMVDSDEILRGRHATRSSSKPIKGFKTYYNNWRRHMGKLQNQLTVEIFGFVNLAACKKIVEGSNLPSRYEIKSGEAACYSSDEHYITDEDAGAPAIRHGQLVAVTVGGAQSDGDHVGVGMTMSCYCSWIADNLPGGGANINCCKTCCDPRNNEDSSRNMFRNRNKYLAK